MTVRGQRLHTQAEGSFLKPPEVGTETRDMVVHTSSWREENLWSGVWLHSSLGGVKLVVHADAFLKEQVGAAVVERNEQHREDEEAEVLVLNLSLNSHVMLSKPF